MLYREVIAVFSVIHTKHINTVCVGAERRIFERWTWLYIEQSFKRFITNYIQYNRSEAEPSNNRKPVFIRKKWSHIQGRPTSRANSSRGYLLDVCFIIQAVLVKSRF
jgi:predicted Fe-S protein YdhL (DUF1289 family)